MGFQVILIFPRLMEKWRILLALFELIIIE